MNKKKTMKRPAQKETHESELIVQEEVLADMVSQYLGARGYLVTEVELENDSAAGIIARCTVQLSKHLVAEENGVKQEALPSSDQ